MRLGLIARILLIVAVALFAIQVLALVIYYGFSGGRAVVGEASPALPRQVASLVRLVERVPPDLRQSVLDAFSEAGRSVSVLPELPADVSRTPQVIRVEHSVRAALALDGVRDRDVWVRLDDTGDGRRGDTITVYVRLASGGYLRVEVSDRVTVRFLGVPIGFFAGLFGVLVAVGALVAVAREMKPLSRLAHAMDRIGEGIDPVVIPERGAPELRVLIRAANAMQERIAHLVRNRTLTLGAISHDLRTYLTRLRLRVEMMPESRHRAGAVADVEAMQALVEDTLDFAQAAFAQADPALADAGAVLRRYRVEHAKAGRIVLDLPDEPVRVAMGEKALERVCANLIENALRYGGTAFLRMVPAPERVNLYVEDDGPGIPPGQRAQVFEPFYRLEGSRNRESGGAGLGLTIVKRIVELHGGTVELGDSPKGGLAVRVSIPAAGQGPA